MCITEKYWTFMHSKSPLLYRGFLPVTARDTINVGRQSYKPLRPVSGSAYVVIWRTACFACSVGFHQSSCILRMRMLMSRQLLDAHTDEETQCTVAWPRGAHDRNNTKCHWFLTIHMIQYFIITFGLFMLCRAGRRAFVRMRNVIDCMGLLMCSW